MKTKYLMILLCLFCFSLGLISYGILLNSGYIMPKCGDIECYVEGIELEEEWTEQWVCDEEIVLGNCGYNNYPNCGETCIIQHGFICENGWCKKEERCREGYCEVEL